MKDYGELAEKLVQKHFPKFGKFRKLCLYRSMSDSTYNPVDSEVTDDIPSDFTIYIIFDEFALTASMSGDRKFDEEPIVASDRIAIFPKLDLPVKPQIGDIIVDDELIEWSVKGISKDPKPAHYELHVRPLGIFI